MKTRILVLAALLVALLSTLTAPAQAAPVAPPAASALAAGTPACQTGPGPNEAFNECRFLFPGKIQYCLHNQTQGGIGLRLGNNPARTYQMVLGANRVYCHPSGFADPYSWTGLYLPPGMCAGFQSYNKQPGSPWNLWYAPQVWGRWNGAADTRWDRAFLTFKDYRVEAYPCAANTPEIGPVRN